MSTESGTVTITSAAYTKLTTASTGYALIYNPELSDQKLKLVVAGTTTPGAATAAYMTINPDEGFQRTSDITNHIWGKMAGGGDIDIVVSEG